MPRSSGVMSWPAGTTAISGDAISSTAYNAFLADLLADLNAARPITAGGTGATSASAARTALGLAIGTDVQAQSTDLSAIALLNTNPYGRSLLEVGTEGALKALINLEIGTDVQAQNANLTTLAAVTPGATGLAILADTTAGAVRTELGIVAYDVYTGSTADNTTFPIGTTLVSYAGTAGSFGRNVSVSVALHSGGSTLGYDHSGTASGTALTGTWRCRGAIAGAGGGFYNLVQRTA